MTPPPKWFMGLCWAMAALFSLSVGLQINDPDPLRWMAMYGGAAVAAALLPGRATFAAGGAAVGLVAAVWGAYLFTTVRDQVTVSDLWMKMSEKGGAVEVGREAAGLAIIAIFLLAASGFRALRLA